MSTDVLGIDPGRHGAIARLSRQGDVISLTPMPDGDRAVVEHLAKELPTVGEVFIEQIPKFAGENRSAAFMAVLYGNYKLLCGAILMHAKVPLTELALLKWMNTAIPMRERSRERTARKRQLLDVAKNLWPESRITLQNCDAPLIARAGLLLSRDEFTAKN
jgi:hypothetical protein